MTAPIPWTCEICHSPINGTDGYVSAPYAALDRLEHERARDRAHDVSAGAHWAVTHAACDPEPEASAVSVSVSTLSSPRKLLAVTAHMIRKGYAADSDWADLVDRASRRMAGGPA